MDVKVRLGLKGLIIRMIEEGEIGKPGNRAAAEAGEWEAGEAGICWCCFRTIIVTNYYPKD